MPSLPSELIQISLLSQLQSSHRYTLSLRSPSSHQTILLYRSPTPPGTPLISQQWYSIVNACPHLGLPLEAGDIEDLCRDEEDAEEEEDYGEELEEKEEGAILNGPIIMCPHHQYDFDLRTGHSSTGSKACTFRVEVREDGTVWMEPPEGGKEEWTVVGIRTVSERFADPPPSSSASDSLTSPLSDLTLHCSPNVQPGSIVSFCRLILLAPSPSHKVSLTRQLVSLFRSGSLTRLSSPDDPPHPDAPYRAPDLVQVLPGKAAKLGKGGSVASRCRMLHSLATIEQWAIDLAVDCVGRFANWRMGDEEGKKGKRMGWEFVSDFLKVAEDEAKHFTLLSSRLSSLGTPYGSLPIHSGLWESATQTSHSLFSRLAIVALVHEARGLDTNPQQILRARKAGDEETAGVLEVIHADEITHVAAGHRHFTLLCASLSPPVNPVLQFRREVQEHFYGHLRGPFNEGDRGKAGMTREWYEELGGRGVLKKAGDGTGKEGKRETVEIEVERA
ncbi:hypothetical protein JCM8547_004559 [Rhodosporidiobolus lusitaniae]